MLPLYAVLTTFSLLSNTVTAPDSTGSALAEASSRNPSLDAYSFHLDAAMAMKHFPWLHFHIAGTGQYVRGERYVVNFTELPWFARSVKQVDLSPLDPSMWSKRYIVSVVTQNDDTTTFLLQPRQSDMQDTQDPHPLVAALVTLDAQQSTRDVVLRYADGQIHLVLTPAQTQGYRLPASFTADIDMPGEALTAQAEFSDYSIDC
jgi:hypothetical protein